MTNKPTTPDEAKKTDVAKQSETAVNLDQPQASTSPSMPHERDEDSSMTDGKPNERIQQGHDDVARGVKDTSRGAETDSTYHNLKK